MNVGKRYDTLCKIGESFVQATPFCKGARINYESLKTAAETYAKELQKQKERLDIKKLDKHKVAALTTIVLSRHKPIVVDPALSQNNAFLKIANPLFALHAGFADIGIPSEMLKDDSIRASLLSQLDLNDATILSLSLSYYLIEKITLLKKESVAIR